MKKRSIFGWLGRYVTRWPVSVIGIWLALPTALFFAFPPLSQAIEEHPVPLVPPSAPEAFPGICCASAPVWWPNGTCAGALTALVQ